MWIPFSKPRIAAARRAGNHQLVNSMREFNTIFRSMRLVVENSIARIKEWSIVGTEYRGNINKQGMYFDLCARLTARMMRVRDKYPRTIEGILSRTFSEDWEQELGWALFVDAENPDMYDMDRYLDL